MRIQELERLVGADRATIRYYEKEGLITPERLENGYRNYTQENADELKKIRLLRQLGMSIDKIRRLQQGSADFSEVLSEQVKTLSAQITEQKRARAVCQAIHDDGAEYRTMDAEHYLKLLREIQVDDRGLGHKEFQEDVPKEIHPWRRYFARTLDYAMLHGLVQFLIVVVLRIRPLPGEFMNALITIGSAALFVPIEAFMLSRWGTTPGKLAMGIRLESIQGGNLTFQQALSRSWLLYQAGMGFCISIVEPFVHIYRYCQLTGRRFRAYACPEEMPWDEETEFTYSRWTGKRGAVLAALIALYLLVSLTTGMDSIRPKYRGSELTIAQFAENYNHSLTVFSENVERYDKLQPDGTKYQVPNTTIVVDFNAGGEYEPQEFEYETENGILRSVAVNRHYEDVFYLTPLSGDRIYLAFSVLLAQDGCGFPELIEFATLCDRYSTQPNARFTYQNIEVSWDIQSENCINNNGTYFPDQEDADATLDYRFVVTINSN